MSAVKAWVTKLLSGKDNVTPDIARVMGASGFIWMLGLETWHVYQSASFDIMQSAQALGVAIAATGVAVGVKTASEPGPTP